MNPAPPEIYTHRHTLSLHVALPISVRASAAGELPPVLSVRQPWPFAIFHGGKDVENRPRRSHHRGPLLIHSSASITREEAEDFRDFIQARSEEHTSELPSLMRISYAVFCLKKKKHNTIKNPP